MMHTAITRSLWICAALLAGCSPQSDKKNAEPEKTAVQVELNSDEKAAKAAKAVFPPEEGVFLMQNGEFHPIQAGAEKSLMPTNAERGFGFAVPEGTVVQSGDGFAIQTGVLNPSQIQVTSYRGIAVNSGAWFGDVDDSNVAWIPGAVMPASVEVIDGQKGIVNVEFSKPLPPGFYVLHDETMVSARQKSDVTAYYPFIVQGSGAISPWIENAELCFERIYEKYGESVKLEDPENLDVKELKKCAHAQRLARKLAKGEGESEHESFLRTLYLSRLLDSSDPAAHRLILSSMNDSGSRLEQILWKIENQDQIWRLIKLGNQIEDDSVSETVVASILSFYEPQREKTAQKPGAGESVEKTVETVAVEVVDNGVAVAAAGDENQENIVAEEGVRAPVQSILEMSWLPFVKLASGEPELEKLMHRMGSGESWEREVVEILAALQMREIQSRVRQNKKLSAWYKKFEPGVASGIRQLSGRLQLRSVENTVSFGPIMFEGIPEREISSWKATVAGCENDVAACFGKPYKGESAVFIMEHPLNGASYGKEVQGILRDPMDTMRKKPVIDPRTVECVLKAYAQMPVSPALNTTQRVKVAVAVVNTGSTADP